jgi:uridine kinase
MTAAPARLLVTIDGIDGSGKSTLARRLCAGLGARAALLAVDDFRRPVDWRRTDRTELDLYYDERYDLAALDACLQAFLRGDEGCAYDRFDGAREALGDRAQLSFAGLTHLLVEGVFVARLPAAAAAISIYVDIPAGEASRRVRARDVAKGRSEAEVDRRLAQRYLPAHARYQAACRPTERATVLIDNRDVGQPRLMRSRLPPGPAHAPLHALLPTLLGPAPPI